MNGRITKIVYTLFVGQIIINDLDSVFRFKATSFQGNQFMNFFGLRVILHCKNSPTNSILSILILVTVCENIMIIIITLSKTFFLYYRFCTFVKLLPKYIIYLCVRHMLRSSIHAFEPVSYFLQIILSNLFYTRSCIKSIECRISIKLFHIHADNFHVSKKHHGKSFWIQYFGKKSGPVAQVGIEV